MFAAVLAMPVLAVPAILRGGVSRDLLEAAAVGVVVFVALFAVGAVLIAYDGALAWVGRSIQRVRNRSCGTPSRCGRCPSASCGSATGSSDARAALEARAGGHQRPLGVRLRHPAGRARGGRSQPRPSLVLLAFCAAQVLAQIPITPGGLGFVEAGLTAMLALAGVSAGARCSPRSSTGCSRTGCRCRPASGRSVARAPLCAVTADRAAGSRSTSEGASVGPLPPPKAPCTCLMNSCGSWWGMVGPKTLPDEPCQARRGPAARPSSMTHRRGRIRTGDLPDRHVGPRSWRDEGDPASPPRVRETLQSMIAATPASRAPDRQRTDRGRSPDRVAMKKKFTRPAGGSPEPHALTSRSNV